MQLVWTSALPGTAGCPFDAKIYSMANPFDGLKDELKKTLPPSLYAYLNARDAAAHFLRELPLTYAPAAVAKPSPEQQAWEQVGHHFTALGRPYEAIAIHSALYRQMLKAQSQSGQWIHKGMPLVWVSDAYQQLGFPALAKRYLMLTLCEDAVREQGSISPETTGVYFRLVWQHGVSDAELHRYAKEISNLWTTNKIKGMFPEWLLLGIDQGWMTEVPSSLEVAAYDVNRAYVSHLLQGLGEPTGTTLEELAEYLMFSMPGCRTARRQHSHSTDYDLVCAVEGLELDFRSELGRYFVCECKDWDKPADFTTMAKFCRVLDSTKARFGILFSKKGISGDNKNTFAEREQLKVFQDRGIVIVVFDQNDIKEVSDGANLIRILRQKYEAVRLDLRAKKE